MFNNNEFLLLLPSIFQFLDKKSLSAFSLASQFTRRFAFGNRIEFKNLDDNTLDFSIREINYWKSEKARHSQLLRFNFGNITSDIIVKSDQKIRALFQLLAENNILYSFTSTDQDFIKLARILDGIEFKKNLEGIKLSIETWTSEKLFPNLKKFEIIKGDVEAELLPLELPVNLRELAIPMSYLAKSLDLSQFSHLEYLKITKARKGTSKPLTFPSNLKRLEIPANCLLIKGLDLSASHFTELVITKWSGESIKPLAQLNNLRRLKISACSKSTLYLDFSKLSQLEEFNICVSGKNKIRSFALPSKLRKLKFSGSRNQLYATYMLKASIDLAQQCPHLQEFIKLDKREPLFSTFPNTLRKLKISMNTLSTANLNFAKELPLLEELEISGSIGKEIATLTLPSTLRKLHISAYAKSTLYLDLSKLSQLEKLNMIGDGEEKKFNLLTLPSTLRELNISINYFSTQLHFDLNQQCPYLEKLTIAGYNDTCEVLTFPSTLRELQFCVRLEGDGIRQKESIISNLIKLPIKLNCLIINNKDYTEQYLQGKNKLSLLDKSTVASVFAGKPKENSQRTCAEINCTIL